MQQQVIAGYNQWAATYDSQENKTRDLEAICLQQLLGERHCDVIVEMGCGTGKNSAFLRTLCAKLLAYDASEEMLAIAKKKLDAAGVYFEQANLLETWPVADVTADAVVFSLVLEHIEHLQTPFAEAARVLHQGGLLYVGELHPFKQYLGSVARFEVAGQTVQLPAYRHHLSEYLTTALENGFTLLHCLEKSRPGEDVPRILALLFKKN